MPQPPPRKVKLTAALKTIHSEQVNKLQAKHQLECDLLEDIRTFARQRSVIEKEYAQALQKLTSQLLKRDFQAMPDLNSEDGKEHRTAMAVWRVILEEADSLAKKKLQAAEAYLDKISEPARQVKANKVQCMKKIGPQLSLIQGEVAQTVLEMTKAQKTYNIDEGQAHEARIKHKEAEDKLNKKSTGLFQSLASLQKNHAKLKSRKETCESKATSSRNEFLLCMAAANAHHIRYFNKDLPSLIEILDDEIFERIQEYFTIYGKASREISKMETQSCDKILEQAEMIYRDFDLRCFLYANQVMTNLVQYDFEPILEVKCNKISREDGAAHHLDKEARKWATKIAKENKSIKEYQRFLKMLGTGDKVSESGSSEGVSQDPEVRAEELNQNVRKAETARAKAEARIEALREGGVNVDEWLSSVNMDTLGVDDDEYLVRTPSRTSIVTDSSGQADDQEPTYTNYEDEDDFIDETFDYSMGDTTIKSASSQKYPLKCRSIYEFSAGNEDELNLFENEELEIIADGEGDGWVKARNSQGVVGFIPENYILILDENEEIVDAPDFTLQHTDSYHSLEQDFPPPPPPDDMTAVDDQTVELPPPVSPESVNEIAQEVTSYSSGDIEVQLATNTMADGMQLPVGDGPWVRALYNYDGNTADELSFAEGTLIRLVRKDENGIDDGFWEGEINGRVGVFPSLVVEELTDADQFQDFPSPLKSPPDFVPPPPVTVTEPTPDNEVPPPSPMYNGSVTSPTSRRHGHHHYGSHHGSRRSQKVNPMSYESAV